MSLQHILVTMAFVALVTVVLVSIRSALEASLFDKGVESRDSWPHGITIIRYNRTVDIGGNRNSSESDHHFDHEDTITDPPHNNTTDSDAWGDDHEHPDPPSPPPPPPPAKEPEFMVGKRASICVFASPEMVYEAHVWSVHSLLTPTLYEAEPSLENPAPAGMARICASFTPLLAEPITVSIFERRRKDDVWRVNDQNCKLHEVFSGIIRDVADNAAHYAAMQALPLCAQQKGFFTKEVVLGDWVQLNSSACDPRFCVGDLTTMNSNNWVFVPRGCRLRLFNRQDAVRCLDKQWVMLWGDSNQVDLGRQMIDMSYDPSLTQDMSREYDRKLANGDRTARVTVLFSGHPNVGADCMGISSFSDPYVQRKHAQYWEEDAGKPTVVFANSGVHDVCNGAQRSEIPLVFAQAVENYAKPFFAKVAALNPSTRWVWRNAIHTGIRSMCSRYDAEHFRSINEEAYKHIVASNPDTWGHIDFWHMSEAQQFCDTCGDGLHYGRLIHFWPFIEYDYVGRMLVQYHFNYMCPTL